MLLEIYQQDREELCQARTFGSIMLAEMPHLPDMGQIKI